MTSRSVLVKVPATVGNFAGAVGCAALALDATFNLKVTPRRDGRAGIRYFGENGERVPRDRSNLVVRAMEAALHLKGLEFTGADFEVYSTVPVGIGLGSSTAAVLAGLIAADRLYSLGLNEKTVLDLARIYESRLDNLLAAWRGGFIACAGEDYSQVVRRTFLPGDFTLGIVNPEFAAKGADATARGPADPAGPDVSLHRDRARALAALFARPGGRGVSVLEPAAPAMPRTIAPGLEEVLKVRAAGVMDVFVCGSGPAVGILSRRDPDEAIRAVRQRFLEFGVQSTFGTFRPANLGALELNPAAPHITIPACLATERQSNLPAS